MSDSSPRIEVTDIFARAAFLVRRGWQPVLGAGAALGATWGVLDYFGWGDSGAGAGLSVATLLLAASITTSLDDRYVAATKEQRAEMVRTNNIFTLLGASLMSGLGIMFGLVLLVIPGLVLAAWWGLHMPLIVREDTGAVESLSESRRRTRGHVAPLAIAWAIAGTIAIGLLVGGMWNAPIADRLPIEWAIREAVLLAVAFPILPVVACAMYDVLLRARDEAPAASGEGLDRQFM